MPRRRARPPYVCACGENDRAAFYASNDSSCKRCLIARRMESYALNGDQERAAMRAYYRRTKTERQESVRRWQRENHEHVRAWYNAWRTARRRANPELRRAEERARRGGWSREARDYSLILDGDPCSYCGAPSEHVDHIVPIALGGRNEADNLTASCASCNMRKNAMPLLLWLVKREFKREVESIKKRSA